MSDGLRLMPVEAKVTAGDRQIRCHGQFFACARGQQGAVVADTQEEAAFLVEAGSAGSLLANLREQGEFASATTGSGLVLLHPHLMRIG
jgi:hypothetical protein